MVSFHGCLFIGLHLSNVQFFYIFLGVRSHSKSGFASYARKFSFSNSAKDVNMRSKITVCFNFDALEYNWHV